MGGHADAHCQVIKSSFAGGMAQLSQIFGRCSLRLRSMSCASRCTLVTIRRCCALELTCVVLTVTERVHTSQDSESRDGCQDFCSESRKAWPAYPTDRRQSLTLGLLRRMDVCLAHLCSLSVHVMISRNSRWPSPRLCASIVCSLMHVIGQDDVQGEIQSVLSKVDRSGKVRPHALLLAALRNNGRSIVT